MGKLVIDGNSVYELDEACMQKKGEAEKKKRREQEESRNNKKNR